jgi:hypothetical protein
MNKDALLATVIGFVVGLCITGLLLMGPKLMTYLPKISLPTISLGQSNPQTTPTPDAKDFTLTIDSPLNEAIEHTAEVLVSGTTHPKATVIIQTDIDDEVVRSSDDGKYAGKVTLGEGKNDLTVTSYTVGKPETKTVQVFYTPEEL